MGFTDFVSEAGLTLANNYLASRSYIVGNAPSQADVVTFKAFSGAPDAEKYPHVARWYKHIASFEPEFSSLPGDASKAYTAYGPEATELPTNPKDKPAAEEDDDMDLFGSDEEEEDPEVVAAREARLAEYKKKKEGKVKPAAKSIVTLEVKPWDDETNLDELLENVKAIEMDGLVWGAYKWVPVGFGIKKLQINLVVEDEKVSLDELQQQIEEDEDHVQSTDVAAMQKLPRREKPAPATMGFISRIITLFGLVLLAHAGYSAHEHTVLYSNVRLSSASTALPHDIVIEALVSLVIVSAGLVLGTEKLKPISWSEWAGEIEREGGAKNPYLRLEERYSFWDIRAKRKEFAEWVRGNDALEEAK
ncbi:hypothetical protein CNMCM5623_001492 [Aspergillus felis]|uniref:Elongation factor 1-beta n=1 Tax=Aspergillus felis TaxID=1287682 RepID=A0A8H6Q9S3_9EURO|nr:hypothetical protein CNMCM5623_001492 [Aspergillus felis]KAF7180536.1 hypothetical protein CNMCM7691_009827 [Aspergillus felis]